MVLDDATNEIYYGQLVDEESTFTVMAALREVIERNGLFCSIHAASIYHVNGITVTSLQWFREDWLISIPFGSTDFYQALLRARPSCVQKPQILARQTKCG